MLGDVATAVGFLDLSVDLSLSMNLDITLYLSVF